MHGQAVYHSVVNPVKWQTDATTEWQLRDQMSSQLSVMQTYNNWASIFVCPIWHTGKWIELLTHMTKPSCVAVTRHLMVIENKQKSR